MFAGKINNNAFRFTYHCVYNRNILFNRTSVLNKYPYISNISKGIFDGLNSTFRLGNRLNLCEYNINEIPEKKFIFNITSGKGYMPFVPYNRIDLSKLIDNGKKLDNMGFIRYNINFNDFKIC